MNIIFFKPTAEYKKYVILDLINRNSNITQRMISLKINSSVSMVNYYVRDLKERKLIDIKKINNKNTRYFISNKGLELKKLLNFQYLKSIQNFYTFGKKDIVLFLDKLISRNIKYVILYGSGEVARILLQVANIDFNEKIIITAIIDDDKSKQNNFIGRIPIIGIEKVNQFRHDVIFISSYNHNLAMRETLKKIGYSSSKIINFFE